MIENDCQLAITENHAAKFRESIASARCRDVPEDTDPVIWMAHIAGMESMLETLEQEISDYRR